MTPDLTTLRAPAFHIGRHYYRLDPVREGGLRWRFRLTDDLFVPLSGCVPKGRVISFRDKHGDEWMSICDSGIHISQWYCWNGCTPKRYIPYLRVWLGTPDFESAILASCVHDALYQFSCTEHFPLHRSDCDEIFRRLIEAKGGKRIARIYHGAVRRWGRWSGDPTERGEYSTVLHP